MADLSLYENMNLPLMSHLMMRGCSWVLFSRTITPQDADGAIQEISFLGGLLHGYRRVKQAA